MRRLALSVFVLAFLVLTSACGKEKVPCSKSSDCDEGQLCEDGVCLAGVECSLDTDCATGQVCLGRRCIERLVGSPCDDERPCPEELFCADNLPGGYCTLACDSAEDCPIGSVCVVQGGEGICLAACESRDHCRDDYSCSAGVCSPPCSSSADCGGGYVCIGGACEGFGVGLPCANDDACAMDLTCAHQDRGGYCTTSCQSSEDCPAGSICGQLFGERTCLAACRADLDCGEDAVCYQGGCVLRCGEDDCGEGFVCSAGGICRKEGQSISTTIDLGEAEADTPVQFEVPPGTHSVTLMVRGLQQTTYAFTGLIDPEGTQRITGTIDMGFGGGGLSEPHRTMPVTEINTTQIPNSDLAGMELIAGTWSFTFSGGSGVASAVLKQGGEEEGSVPLNIFVAPLAFPGSVNASNLADQAHFQTVLEQWDHFFLDQAGVSRGEVRVFDLPPEYTDIEIDMFSGDLPYEAMFKRFGRDDGLNMFLVRSISMGFMGNIAGISGGIPGPPRIGGTLHSGIVIEVQDEPRFTGLTFCHEAGHFHGLFHLTEQSLFGGPQIHDVISDTPECLSDPCPGPKTHLMWPMLEPTMEILSPASAAVIRANAGVD